MLKRKPKPPPPPKLPPLVEKAKGVWVRAEEKEKE